MFLSVKMFLTLVSLWNRSREINKFVQDLLFPLIDMMISFTNMRYVIITSLKWKGVILFWEDNLSRKKERTYYDVKVGDLSLCSLSFELIESDIIDKIRGELIQINLNLIYEFIREIYEGDNFDDDFF